DESFVSLGELDAERSAVAEVHVHVAHARHLSGHFGGDAHGDAFVGLDAYDELVRRDLLHRRRAEELERRPAELDGDLGDALGEALARTYVEGHARPAPTVEPHRHHRVSFGGRGGRDALLLAVAGDGLTSDCTRAVLTA